MSIAHEFGSQFVVVVAVHAGRIHALPSSTSKMPPMTIAFCGLGSNMLNSGPNVRFSSCSLRPVTLGL